MCCFQRTKTSEEVLRETDLREVYAKMTVTKGDVAHADNWMSNFFASNKEEHLTNSLELDKHIVTISGGAILALITFLGVIKVNQFHQLTQKYVGLGAIWALALSIVFVVLSYVVAVRRGVAVLTCKAISEQLEQLVPKGLNDLKNESLWSEINTKKNMFCDVTGWARFWASLTAPFNNTAQLLFIVGVISLTLFGTLNLIQLSK